MRETKAEEDKWQTVAKGANRQIFEAEARRHLARELRPKIERELRRVNEGQPLTAEAVSTAVDAHLNSLKGKALVAKTANAFKRIYLEQKVKADKQQIDDTSTIRDNTNTTFQQPRPRMPSTPTSVESPLVHNRIPEPGK